MSLFTLLAARPLNNWRFWARSVELVACGSKKIVLWQPEPGTAPRNPCWRARVASPHLARLTSLASRRWRSPFYAARHREMSF